MISIRSYNKYKTVICKRQKLKYTSLPMYKTAELGKGLRTGYDFELGLEGWIQFSQGKGRHSREREQY